MPTKLSRELYLVERFLPTLFEEQLYTLSQPAPPLPDIVIQVNGRKIGIEITDIILDEQIRKREASQDAILDEAQRLFEEEHHLPLHVTVDFVDSASWKKRECQQVAVFLADAIKHCVLQVKGLSQYQAQFDIGLDNIIHTHIQHVSIFYSSKLTIPCWSPITSFWVPNAPVEIIQTIINRKSKNVNGYLTGCDEVWLLMLETGSPSSYIDHFDKLKETSFVSGFARTLIGRISKGELITLETNP
jgi:hypothetical protein